MLRRAGLAVVISVVLGILCFGLWVSAQYILLFKPYGDPQDAPSPLARSAVDGHLYVGIAMVMAGFVLLNLSSANRFGFLGGLWWGAVASAGGPFAWTLPLLFFPGRSLLESAGLVAVLFLASFFIWAALGVPLFVGVAAGLLSWPARGILARGDRKRTPHVPTSAGD